MSNAASIRVGIGGWSFAPWRGHFYPPGLAQSQALHYASRQMTAIEVNATFYRNFKPDSFAKWRDATPEGFVFSLKANRFTTHRRVLAEAGDSIQRFVNSGISELGPKLGPLVWQFMPTKRFDPVDFEAFLALLPREVKGLALRHALDVRHESFATPQFLELAQRYGCVAVHTDADDTPGIAHPDAPFAYIRLKRSAAEVSTGYPPAQIAQWAQGAKTWASGRHARDAFIYFINGAKDRAPAGAMALIKALEKVRD